MSKKIKIRGGLRSQKTIFFFELTNPKRFESLDVHKKIELLFGNTFPNFIQKS